MRTTVLITVISLVCLSGCSTNSVVTDYDPLTRFEEYASFNVTDNAAIAEEHSPLLQARLQSAIERTLKSSGYSMTANGQRDFSVKYHALVLEEDKSSKTKASVGFGGGSNSSGFGVALSFPLGEPSNFQQFKIMIDVIDGATNKLSWRGSDILTITDDTPEEITEKVQQLCEKILAEFPPSNG